MPEGAPRLSLALSSERVDGVTGPEFSGVGLVRGEYVFRRRREYVTVPGARAALTSYLREVAAAFAPRPVWYRTSELEAAEVAVLDGGDDDSLVDPVPILGTRGIRRALRHPESFDLELGAFRDAADDFPNLGLLFPFVTEAAELDWALGRCRAVGVAAPVGVMAEIPAAVVCLDAFLALGAVRVLVGANDLWGLTMGVYRTSDAYRRDSDGFRRMLDLARAATAARGVELAMAGYLTPQHLGMAADAGLDECAVHYSDLPALLGPRYAALPDLHVLHEVKTWTRAAIAARELRRPVPAVDGTSLGREVTP
jgi:phosphoenolpyruvate-protein kinase (PTS system EI component)